MLYPLYIFFGLAPSFIWLLFFLRKDSHPEPKRMVLKIFSYGMFSAIIAALIEKGIFASFSSIGAEQMENYFSLSFILYNLVGIAFIEEFVKYLVVRKAVLNHPEFDEPVDAVLYMIIVALGFATLENISVFWPRKEALLFTETIIAGSLRFIGATFLHALCSGTVGYFLALSFLEQKKQIKLISLGLTIATLLHGFFNISIIKMAQEFRFFVVPIIILIGLTLFVFYGFKKVKKLASVCKIK